MGHPIVAVRRLASLQHLGLPIWAEAGRMPAEFARLRASAIWQGRGIEDAAGQPVVLIPGFLASDDTLGFMASWLRRTGHRPRRAGIASNIACSTSTADLLLARIERAAEESGQRVAIVGHSRGGMFGRVLAVRRPDLVSGVVALGSPLLDPLRIHPALRLQIAALGVAGSLGVPGLLKIACSTGGCCDDHWEHLFGPFPEDVGFVSVYSRSDGVVDWRTCLDPEAEQREVKASHCGMAVHADVYREIARALAMFRHDGAAHRRPAALPTGTPSATVTPLRRAA